MVVAEENLTEHHKEKKKKQFKDVLRILISIIAFICLIKFGKVDIRVAFKYLLTVNPVYFSLAYLCYFLATFISAIRFKFSSSVLGFKKTYWQLVQLNFIGAFFNNFLPTTFGGDALRGYYLKKGSPLPMTKAVACIIYERYTGVIILFWAASVAFILQDLGIITTSEWSLPSELKLFSHVGSFVAIFLIPFLPQIHKRFLGEKGWLYKKA